MRINFYDARITDDDKAILVKERGINYETLPTNNPEKIVQMMWDLLHLGELAEEHCYMVAMNSACKVIGIFLISKGTVNASLITPREVFMRAMLIGSVQIILCHNHPSHSPLPSEQDIKLTKVLKEAGELLHIRLADHIIIGKDSYLSFKEANLM